MDPVKEAFVKIKEEMLSLKEEIFLLKKELLILKESKDLILSPTSPTHVQSNLATPSVIPTHNPTVPQEMKGLNLSYSGISTGNEGVPTNSQSNRPTNQQTHKLDNSLGFLVNSDGLNDLHETIETLDNLKKELRILIKGLTPQEMMVFSTLYGLESQGFEEISYKTIASSLRLSESSIRDYINKLIIKGIPIKKIRQNNKKILLNISSDLKKVASLSTILRLREI
jgi:biotin operon repressor